MAWLAYEENQIALIKETRKKEESIVDDPFGVTSLLRQENGT